MNNPAATVFNLDQTASYMRWRDGKIAGFPRQAAELTVDIGDLSALTRQEQEAISDCIGRANFAIYTCRDPDKASKSAIRVLGRQFGLTRLDENLCADEDGVSSLQVSAGGRSAEYIPYTNKPLSWHTDGYYNRLEQSIRAFIIHCASPAAAGGVNALLDPEMLYIAMRDANPDYIKALMVPDVMTIPANLENGVEIRPVQSGPVFSVDARSGALHMRYTARKRNIIWKNDAITLEAVAFLEAQLRQSTHIFSHQLRAGQGIICNNVLHNRSGFEDNEATGQRRLMYRARYFDRIGTRHEI